MDRFVTITRNTSKIFDYVAAACFFLIMAVVVINILLRFGMRLHLVEKPLMGAIELVSILSVIGIGAALAYSAYNNAQIAVSFVIEKLPRQWQKIIDIVINLIGFVFWGASVYFVLISAQAAASNHLITATLHIPLYPAMYVLAAELALLCMVLLAKIFMLLGESTQ